VFVTPVPRGTGILRSTNAAWRLPRLASPLHPGQNRLRAHRFEDDRADAEAGTAGLSPWAAMCQQYADGGHGDDQGRETNGDERAGRMAGDREHPITATIVA